MIQRSALSASAFAAELLGGPTRQGRAIGARYALFGEDVLALTPPEKLRMPNGIETDVSLTPGEVVVAGNGKLQTSTVMIACGPLWDARPDPRFRLSLSPRPDLRLDRLPGRGPGLTPLGDDVLVGYLAAAALAGADSCSLAIDADRAARLTTALSGTLLRLAASGDLPEAAHRLLEDGDLKPLLDFGATSGRGIAVGLCLFEDATALKARGHAVEFTLPLRPSTLRLRLIVAPR